MRRSPKISNVSGLDKFEFLETTGSAMVCELDEDEIEMLKAELTVRLKRRIDIDVMVPVSLAYEVLEATGRKKTEEDE